MTLSKAFYRFLGTSVGALFAIILIRFFGHQPIMFIILLALWVGLATGVANIVQYFRAYGSMLAGFTAALVGFSVYSHPDQVVEVAGSRIFGIFLGIAITLFMASFLIPSSSKRDLFWSIDEIVTELLNWTADVFLRKPRVELIEGERKLIARISQIEEYTSYAAAESMQIRKMKRHLHGFLSTLFSTISAARAAGLHWRKYPDLVTSTTNMREQTAQILRSAAPLSSPETLLPLTERLKSLFSATASETTTEYKVMNERLANFLTVSQKMFEQYLSVRQKDMSGSAKELAFHRDIRHARVVGIRSTLAMLSVGILWLATGWTLGPLMIILTAVNCGIFATSSNPKSGILVAFRASVLAIAAAFLCHRLLIVGPQSLWFLFFLLSIFLIPGGIFVTHPTRSLAGTLFCANFLMFLSPTYPLQPFHFEQFFYLGLAYFASTAVNYFFFYFVLPTDPHRRSGHVIRDIVRDLERMARASTDVRAFEWETLMYNRVSNLIKYLAETGETKQGILEGSFAALDIGQDILRFQSRLKNRQTDQQAQIMQRALQALSSFTKDPKATAAQLQTLAKDSTEAHTLNEVADLLVVHAEFFKIDSSKRSLRRRKL